ncbi:MAG: DUF1302 family protein [Thermodesulfobacteriota bacterium]|nr:DUF1302 family protein [Thermodesulfobacteriota bacterium]
MKTDFSVRVKVWLLFFLFLFVVVTEARGDIQLADNFSVTGFLRHEFALHTGGKNPNNNQDDNNKINLSRSFFITEWTYLPSDMVKLYAKARLLHDQTEQLDSDLNEFDAFPLSTPRYGTYLRANNDDDFAAELWELYGDLNVGNLLLRLGKQQIVWGEMISSRILDIINPLEMSWHWTFEPEEYENIRVPQWSIRAVYNVEQMISIPWLNDVYLEGFLNPGDFVPTIMPEPGAPFNVIPAFPPFFNITETDRRGDLQYGFRLGYRIGQFFSTLNYLHLYTQNSYLDTVGGGPPPNMVFMKQRYPATGIYGMSVNYAFPQPYNIVVTYEGTYFPRHPYYDAAASLPEIKKQGTLKHAIRFDRKTFVFPRPTSAMTIQVQYSQSVVEGDEGKIAGSGSTEIDKTVDTLVLNMSQMFRHDTISVSNTVVYDLDGAYYIKPGFQYLHGDDWYFDIYGIFLGGSEKRSGRLGSMSWADEVYARVTYQF